MVRGHSPASTVPSFLAACLLPWLHLKLPSAEAEEPGDGSGPAGRVGSRQALSLAPCLRVGDGLTEPQHDSQIQPSTSDRICLTQRGLLRHPPIIQHFQKKREKRKKIQGISSAAKFPPLVPSCGCRFLDW